MEKIIHSDHGVQLPTRSLLPISRQVAPLSVYIFQLRMSEEELDEEIVERIHDLYGNFHLLLPVVFLGIIVALGRLGLGNRFSLLIVGVSMWVSIVRVDSILRTCLSKQDQKVLDRLIDQRKAQ